MKHICDHNHAKGYLIDLACADGTPDWLAYIIYGMICTGGRLEDKQLEVLAEKIVNGRLSKFDESRFNTIPQQGDALKTVKLKKLIHHSGVNALASNIEVKFGPDVTVLYGHNGSGKSGYFRILNEVSGASIEHEILPNVYDGPSQISVHLDYEKDGQCLGFDWDGTRGAVSDLNALFVFDNFYALSLLEKRSLSNTVVEPFGLRLFRAVTDKIDVFKRIIGDHISDLRKRLPILNVALFSPDIQRILNNEDLFVGKYPEEIKPIDFSSSDSSMLQSIMNQINDLKQNDTTLSIRHKHSFQMTLKTLLATFQEEASWVRTTVNSWNDKLSHYASTYAAAKNAQAQYSVISGIPGSDSNEWKEFIEKGMEYASKHAEQYRNVCPFCHQPIVQRETMEVLQSYSKFLSDKTQRECSLEWKNLSAFQKEILSKKVSVPSVENYKPELEAIHNKSLGSLYNLIVQMVGALIKCKETIDTCVSNLQIIQAGLIDITPVEQTVGELIRSLGNELQKLMSDGQERQKTIQQLDSQRIKLEQKRSLMEAKALIAEHYALTVQIRKMSELYESISSRRVSDLSRVAHEHLLTDALKTKFDYWLRKFDFPHLSVTLAVSGIVKGVPMTELQIINDQQPIQHALQTVLSEGEQKAVSLAMFLTEAELGRANAPIIFDDPVNSLDNRVIEQFAHMLMELNQQVVVFTHNRLFLDALQVPPQPSLWHVCKNYNNGCSSAGKHIYLWETEAFEGRTGLIGQMKGDSANALLDRVHDKLEAGVLDDDQKLLVAASLRRAIEKLIDERLLKNVQPCRFNVSKSCINWPLLASLNADPVYQQQHAVLQREFGRLSNRRLHEGESSRERPLTQTELKEVCLRLMEL